MKFIVRRASQCFNDSYDPPCEGAIQEEIKGSDQVDKVWTIDLSDMLQGLLAWTQSQGGRIVIEKFYFSDLFVITIYDYWIE